MERAGEGKAKDKTKVIETSKESAWKGGGGGAGSKPGNQALSTRPDLAQQRR